MPDPNVQPPTVAQADDPFAALRVVDLLARLERGVAVRASGIAAALNSRYLDWVFSPAVVTHVALQLQANWMTDYRNASGIVIEDSAYGTTIQIEDSSRVDPWFVRQAEALAAQCRTVLFEFSKRDWMGAE